MCTNFVSQQPLLVLLEHHQAPVINNWFELIEQGMESARGAEMFDGGSGMNVAIVSKSTIVPRIKVCDVLNITYRVKDVFKINNVRIQK